jgi:hypothetical protein
MHAVTAKSVSVKRVRSVMPCCLADVNWCSSETLVNFCHITRLHVPAGRLWWIGEYIIPSGHTLSQGTPQWERRSVKLAWSINLGGGGRRPSKEMNWTSGQNLLRTADRSVMQPHTKRMTCCVSFWKMNLEPRKGQQPNLNPWEWATATECETESVSFPCPRYLHRLSVLSTTAFLSAYDPNEDECSHLLTTF